jgi:hypothetical protein
MATNLDIIIAALGLPEALKGSDRHVLADPASSPQAGTEALTPDASWAVAAEELGLEALEIEIERRNGHQAVAGVSLKGVSHLRDASTKAL